MPCSAGSGVNCREGGAYFDVSGRRLSRVALCRLSARKHPRRSVTPPMTCLKAANVVQQRQLRCCPRTWCLATPVVMATARYAGHAAHDVHRPGGRMLPDEGERHRGISTKPVSIDVERMPTTSSGMFRSELEPTNRSAPNRRANRRGIHARAPLGYADARSLRAAAAARSSAVSPQRTHSAMTEARLASLQSSLRPMQNRRSASSLGSASGFARRTPNSRSASRRTAPPEQIVAGSSRSARVTT